MPMYVEEGFRRRKRQGKDPVPSPGDVADAAQLESELRSELPSELPSELGPALRLGD
jgi:hypothetical protein